MLVNEEDAAKRLNSPMNLINRLKSPSRTNAMSLFGINRSTAPTESKEIKVSFNPFKTPPLTLPEIPPSEEVSLQETHPVLNDILDNHESQIRLGLAHDNALELLNNSVKMLSNKLDDIRADKLPAVVSAASKTVESIRRERNEQMKNGKDKEVHYHFYTPEQKKVVDYQIIDVT